MATTVKQKMKLEKKNSVAMLFRPDKNATRPIVMGLYLMKPAYVGLGSPDEITLTVEATE